MPDADEPLLAPPDVAGWESWLAEHHGTSGPVWVRLARRGSGLSSPTAVEAVEVALCYGWIDSMARSLDERSYRQRFSRRRPRSAWSAVNVARVERLLAEGRMREPGLAEVRSAQADGRWERAYPAQRDDPVPAELEQALRERPAAAARFHALRRTERYLLVLPLLKAATPEARHRQLARVLHRLEGG